LWVTDHPIASFCVADPDRNGLMQINFPTVAVRYLNFELNPLWQGFARLRAEDRGERHSVGTPTIVTAADTFGAKEKTMKRLVTFLLLFLAGCAASQEDLNAVAVQESGRLAKPSVPLSTFASYELEPMTMSSEIQGQPDKVKQGAVLKAKIEKKLQPLLTEWSASAGPDRQGILVVEPELARLRIVSGGARFWAGAFVGDSVIDLDLVLRDDAGNVIARPRITKEAGAMGGAWSVGKSDKNLHDYIVQIVYQYMIDNY
jgi:hypothetical protein